MDTTRARRELGWQPRHSAQETLLELLDGMRDGADSAPLRWIHEQAGPCASASSCRV